MGFGVGVWDIGILAWFGVQGSGFSLHASTRNSKSHLKFGVCSFRAWSDPREAAFSVFFQLDPRIVMFHPYTNSPTKPLNSEH